MSATVKGLCRKCPTCDGEVNPSKEHWEPFWIAICSDCWEPGVIRGLGLRPEDAAGDWNDQVEEYNAR